MDTFLQRAFEASFREGVEELTMKQKILLALRFGLELSDEQIAARMDTDPKTAARWVLQARGALVLATRRAMVRRMDLGPSDVPRILGVVRARIDLRLAMMVLVSDAA